MEQFTPKKPAEREYFAVRFTRLLPAGVTIVSAQWFCTVLQGDDPAAAAMVSGGAIVAGDKVSQLIIDGVDGVQYDLECEATLSDGQKVRMRLALGQGLHGLMPCSPPKIEALPAPECCAPSLDSVRARAAERAAGYSALAGCAVVRPNRLQH
jgi:hypothetical protein